MNALEDLIRDSLQDRADRAGTFTGLDTAAIRRAHRRRARRRASAIGTAGAILLASGGALGWRALPPSEETLPPSASDPAHTVEVDPTEFPEGPAPKVPTVVDGVLHDGDRTVRLRTDLTNAYAVAPLGDGYAVEFHDQEEAIEVRWFAADGSVKRTLPSMPRLSADGELAAFHDSGGPDRVGELMVMDLTAEKITARTEVDPGVIARGFVGDRVAYSHNGARAQTSGLWDPASGERTRLNDLSVLGTDGSRLLGTTGSALRRECSGMFRPNGERIWTSCEDVLTSISPDRTHRYLTGVATDDETTIVVRKATDGQQVFELTGAPVDRRRAVAEPDGSLLVVAGVEDESGNVTREALIRIRPDGRGERVSDLVPTRTLQDKSPRTPAIPSNTL